MKWTRTGVPRRRRSPAAHRVRDRRGRVGARLVRARPTGDAARLGAGGARRSVVARRRSREARRRVAADHRGAGLLFAAALETALKIKETCSLLADGYSAAGPAPRRRSPARDARPCPWSPLLRVRPGAAPTSRRSSRTCARGRRACSSSATTTRPTYRCRATYPRPLAPIAAVVRGQQLAHELATALGYDPDSHRA